MLGRIATELMSDRTKAVFVHGNGDMDAFGSAYAIARCFPGCAIFAPRGLDRVAKMVAARLEVSVYEGYGESFDEIVVVDTSTPDQIEAPEGFRADIVIDHHLVTGKWTDVPLFYCDDRRTSCCEIVKEIIDTAGIPIPRDVALALMGGMLTDSGHFQYARPGLLTAFSDLMRLHDIDMGEAVESVMAEVSISERIATLKAVSRISYDRIGQLIVATSNSGSFEASSCRAILASGADIAFVGSQRNEEFRISARAGHDAVSKGINLGEIMATLGGESMTDGGGHDGAAGLNGVGDVEAMLFMCMEKTKEAMRRIKASEDIERERRLNG